MIGNDVVDLKLAAAQSNWKRSGFLEKVFTAFEREQIWKAKDRAVMVWLLWSMKEAAYKAHQRKFQLPRNLNWHRQECEVTEYDAYSAFGVVIIESKKYFSHSEISSDVVFTSVVNDHNIGVKDCVFARSSEAVKKKFLREVSHFYSLPQVDLKLQKNSQGIPFLKHCEEEFPCAFSFTGHGRFTAFSLALMNC